MDWYQLFERSDLLLEVRDEEKEVRQDTIFLLLLRFDGFIYCVDPFRFVEVKQIQYH